jgi:hypothetical protein
MIEQDLLKNNLQISLRSLAYSNLLKPHHKNYLWSRAYQNIFGVEEIRPRVGKFATPWHNTSVFPVPDLDQPFDKKFNHIVDQRACEIFQHAKSSNKKIVIMWSGGIDSTCMLSSFIKNLSATDLQQVLVCTSLAGVEENPWFYYSQIQGRFEMLHWRDLDLTDAFFDKHILLHGDPGDCIFGPSLGKYKVLCNNRDHLRSWKSNRSILYFLYHDPVAVDFGGWWVDKVSENLLELQNQGLYTNITTISDWHWWNYYNLKWQGSLTRPLVGNKKNLKDKISRHHIQEFFDLAFFTHPDFQIWSYQNLQHLLAHGVSGHKRHAKEYIYALDNNQDYLANKIKVESVVDVWHKPLIVDLNGVHYHHTEPEVQHALDTLLET